MAGKPVNFWIILVVGVAGAGVALWTLTDFAGAMLAHAGPWGLLTPVILSKVGELLIATPLYLTLLTRSIWPRDKVAANLKAAWPTSLAGAALNLAAWLTDGRPLTDPTKLWFAALLVIGVAPPPVILRLLTRPSAR